MFILGGCTGGVIGGKSSSSPVGCFVGWTRRTPHTLSCWGWLVRAPVAVVCLVSAAALHELCDELPLAVQIAVPRGARSPRITLPPVEVFHFDALTFQLGLGEVQAAPGEWVRVYTAARTVVDLMRFRHRIGEPLALGALRRYLASTGARPGLLLDLAGSLDVLGPVRAAVDVLEAS